MVVKSAREILESAKYLAGVRNSRMTNFFQVVNILNNIYRDIYRKITTRNSLYLKEYPITGNDWVIPSDVYTIVDVYQKQNNIITPINRGSYGRNDPNCYYVENNKIKFNGVALNNLYVKCSLLPETITCPDDSIPAPDECTVENGYLLNSKYYYTNEDKQYVWDIMNNVITESEAPIKIKWSSMFNEQHVGVYPDKGYIIIDNKDATSTFIVEDGVKIVAASFCDPYGIVSYDNGHTYLFKVKKGNYYNKDNEIQLSEIVEYSRWNPDNYTGHETLAKVISLHTNDMTGDGVVYLDLVDNKIKFGSFVPDTIIASPTNILFTYLEIKLAAYLSSITGNVNEYLSQDLLADAEQQLADSISTDSSSPVLMKNVTRINY